jgi:hypothetical protein
MAINGEFEGDIRETSHDLLKGIVSCFAWVDNSIV